MVVKDYNEVLINGTIYRCNCSGTGCPIMCANSKTETIEERIYAHVSIPEKEFYAQKTTRNNGHPSSPRRRNKK